ncbi:MAG: hypothetical protein Q4E53_10190 [Eubacteriales bacterium]|nr:hypothetical protein [Eubacteriales bacterium]
MKKIFKNLLFVFACALVISIIKPAQVNAQEDITVKSSVNSKYQVTLKWKKQSCSQIRIYRSQVTPTGNLKRVLLKTLKGSATTYVDKKTKKKIAYDYTVSAYKKVKGKYVLVASGEKREYCGLIKPEYDEYLFEEGEYTPHSIKLVFGISSGMTPNGYQIQRKAGNGSYKTVKTLKTTKRSNVTWNNTGLTTLTQYTYRVRSYKKIGKKKIYSNWSAPYSKITALRYGTYSAMNFTVPSSENGLFVLAMKSDSAKNAVLNCGCDFNRSDCLGDCEIEIVKITKNGKDVDLNSFTVSPNEVINIYFKSSDLYNTLKTTTENPIICFGGVYNGTPVLLYFDTVAKGIAVEADAEAIH